MLVTQGIRYHQNLHWYIYKDIENISKKINRFFFGSLCRDLNHLLMNHFAPELQKVIKDFKRQRYEIKREETILYTGSVFCLNVGLFEGFIIVGGIVSTLFVADVPTPMKAAGATMLLFTSVAFYLLKVIQNPKIKTFFSTLKGPTRNIKYIVQK